MDKRLEDVMHEQLKWSFERYPNKFGEVESVSGGPQTDSWLEVGPEFKVWDYDVRCEYNHSSVYLEQRIRNLDEGERMLSCDIMLRVWDYGDQACERSKFSVERAVGSEVTLDDLDGILLGVLFTRMLIAVLQFYSDIDGVVRQYEDNA